MTSWIVVGAGSAGAVVASRVSEDPEHHVVVVESGSVEPPPATGPSFFDAVALPGRTHEGLVAMRVDGQAPAPYLRGRGLGGSGAINAMVALRGGPFDADHRLHTELASEAELGPVDRALLTAAPDARRVPLTRRGEIRVTVADAYLSDASQRPNLELVGERDVDRVLLTGRQAVGVVLSDGTEIRADRVVICAGAIHSPAILLRSRLDTPGVGLGLKDHPSAPLTLGLRADAASDPSSLAVGTLLERGSIQVLPLNHVGRSAPGYGVLMPSLMRVRSEGAVSLVDDDPATHPRVEFRMLSHPDDVTGLTNAVVVALELLEHPAFGSIVHDVYVDDLGTTTSALRDRRDIADWLGTHVGDYVHAACSCRMGTVVDEQCRVIGYEGLYVCDASVFPDIPEVNTHLPTVMLAETMVTRWRRNGR